MDVMAMSNLIFKNKLEHFWVNTSVYEMMFVFEYVYIICVCMYK